MPADHPYYLYPRRPSGILYYQFKHSKERGSTGTRDEKEAHAFMQRLTHGTRQKPAVASILGAFAKGFFDEGNAWLTRQRRKGKGPGPSNLSNRRGFLKNHIVPAFGNRAIESLSAEEIEDWLIDLDRANSTRNQILFTFRIILDEALRRGLVARNVARAIEQFPADSNTPDTFTDADLRALFPTEHATLIDVWSSFDVAVMAYLSLVSGARQGELRALTWRDVNRDENGGLLIISKTVRSDGSIGTPKNGKSRVALIDERAAAFLEALRIAAKPAGEDEYVFTADGENPWWTNYTYKYFEKALTNADIECSKRRVTFHSFRHTYVTRLRRHRVGDEMVVATVGHSSAAVTDIYDHSEIEDRRRELKQYRSAHASAFSLPTAESETEEATA